MGKAPKVDLIRDLRLVVEDWDALVRATADDANERVAAARKRST